MASGQGERESAHLRWYNRDISELTPFGQLLVEWMREQQIVAQSELAHRLGVKQQAVSEYLRPAGQARIPRPSVLQRISHASGIPLATLYLAAGVPLYDDIEALPPSPAPKRASAPAGPSGTVEDSSLATMWHEFYRRIDAFNLPRETRESIIDLAEDLRRGSAPYARHRIAEHTVVESGHTVLPQPVDHPDPTPIGSGDDDENT